MGHRFRRYAQMGYRKSKNRGTTKGENGGQDVCFVRWHCVVAGEDGSFQSGLGPGETPGKKAATEHGAPRRVSCLRPLSNSWRCGLSVSFAFFNASKAWIFGRAVLRRGLYVIPMEGVARWDVIPEGISMGLWPLFFLERRTPVRHFRVPLTPQIKSS